MNATEQAIDTPGAARSGSVKQTLFGRFMLPDMSEHACQVNSITIDGATFLTTLPVPPGLTIVAYLEEVGRIEATSANPVDGGFQVTFNLTGARRDRFETRLKWLNQKETGQTIEDRRHTRYEPKEKQSQITMPDGREYACEVVDISLSGAAVKVEVMPSLGTYILLGKMRGRVVRYLESGIAIEFVKLLDRNQLSDTVR
ncbi:PilZ domain-containing protein [Aestuariivirga sp.]|uniref:PilZ domain-containing protein n=1 Tax=Aestuariivirga sp. TaxID=2650926 RepID=UPI0035939D2B